MFCLRRHGRWTLLDYITLLYSTRFDLTQCWTFVISEVQRYDHLYGKYGSVYPGVAKAEGGGYLRRPSDRSLIHVCPKCGNGYTANKSLQRHLRYECGLAPRFKCPYCEARCKQKAHVNEHIRRKHTGKRIYIIESPSWTIFVGKNPHIYFVFVNRDLSFRICLAMWWSFLFFFLHLTTESPYLSVRTQLPMGIVHLIG